ncbi:MAG: hypothetical protein OEV60_10115 [Actinomycetota bacterium]|nr:hypothetical protein [Actinomycetota bacterium]MDH5223944.1 hypothetical protein [Actinomycetota bacterium]MDH5313745.1 hypothetical protein [Actinomycetota bacterium]
MAPDAVIDRGLDATTLDTGAQARIPPPAGDEPRRPRPVGRWFIVIAAAVLLVAGLERLREEPAAQIDPPRALTSMPTGALISSNDGTRAWPPPISATVFQGDLLRTSKVALPAIEGAVDWDWSPDLTHLLWLEQIAPREPDHSLVIGGIDGTEPVVVARVDGSTAYRGRAWSADGSRVAFAIWVDGITQVHVADAATGETRTVRRWDDTVHVDVDWAPDASRLVLAIAEGPDAGVMTIAPDGTEPERVSNLPAYRVAWSPIDPLLAVEAAGPAEASSGVWLIDLRAGTERRLSPADVVDLGPTWSPDGGWIAFSRDSTPDRPSEQPQVGTAVFLMRADGTDVRPVSLPTDRGWHEVWDWLPETPPVNAVTAPT